MVATPLVLGKFRVMAGPSGHTNSPHPSSRIIPPLDQLIRQCCSPTALRGPPSLARARSEPVTTSR